MVTLHSSSFFYTNPKNEIQNEIFQHFMAITSTIKPYKTFSCVLQPFELLYIVRV